MKQVTGNNPAQSYEDVSIQLSLDGHSFSPQVLSAIPANDEPIEVELLSPRSMLVPAELFSAENAEALLAANGTPLLEDERAVCSAPQGSFVAITAVNRDVLQEIESRLGNRIRYTTPLLRRQPAARKTLWLYRKGGISFLKVYRNNGILQLAEAVPTATDADLLYLFQRLDSLFPLSKYELRIAGDNPEAIARLCGKQFRQVRCE